MSFFPGWAVGWLTLVGAISMILLFVKLAANTIGKIDEFRDDLKRKQYYVDAEKAQKRAEGRLQESETRLKLALEELRLQKMELEALRAQLSQGPYRISTAPPADSMSDRFTQIVEDDDDGELVEQALETLHEPLFKKVHSS